MFKKSVLAIAFLWVATPAFADVCASGNLANLIGTTCDIGSLQFTFTQWLSQNYTYDAQTSEVTNLVSGPAADSFTFTVVDNGFSISGASPVLFGPGPDDSQISSDFGALLYNITSLTGYITGGNVTATGISATGTIYSYSGAYGEDSGDSVGFNGIDAVYQLRGSFGEYYGPSAPYNPAYSLFVAGSGEAEVYDLVARDATDSASWDGAATFTFSPPSPFPNPEPSSSLLFGTAACLFYAARRWKLTS